MDNLENKIKENSRRSFLKKTVAWLGAAVMASWLGIACNSPNGTTPPPTQYKHEISVIADYLQGGTASGTYDITMLNTSKAYTGAIGQKIDLATTTIEKEPCDILIKADGALPREYKQILITNNTINTNVVRLATFDLDGLLKEVLYEHPGKNESWTPRSIKAIFNPDSNGIRLPQGYIDEIKRAMNNIKAWSGNYIQTLTFDENGNKIIDSSVPPEGEIWVFKWTELSGASNATYPSSSGKVTSSKIFINQDSAFTYMAYNETFDAFVQGEQNIGEGKPDWWLFMMNRPRDTNEYTITKEKESQLGLDNLSQIQTYAQTKILITKDPTAIGNFMGEPEYREFEQIVQTRNTPLRPEKELATKDYKREKK